MLKLWGTALILLGALLALLEWRMGRIRRQQRLKELIRFLHRSEYALQKEQMRNVDLFREYSGEGGLLRETLRQTADYLDENRFCTGEEAWQAAFSDRKEAWSLTSEEWEAVRGLGRAFFGSSRRELGQMLESGREQLESLLETEQRRFLENQKVVMPVGMLGAVLLILLLV